MWFFNKQLCKWTELDTSWSCQRLLSKARSGWQGGLCAEGSLLIQDTVEAGCVTLL